MANYVLTVAFVAFLVASCAGVAIDTRSSDSHNVDQCDASKAVVSLYSTNVYEPAIFLGFAKRVISFPESTINKIKITCLKVINMDTTNHGGYPKIVYGGVGATDVQILLTSRFGLPLNFRIEIWG